MEFNAAVLIVLFLFYGIVKSLLYHRRTGDKIAVVLASTFLVLITNVWVDMYGGRLKDLFATFQSIFNFIPLIIFFGYIYLETLRAKEQKEKEKVKNFFGKYVSRSIVDQILQKGVQVSGKKQEISVLYTDIRGFTSMSEKLPAEDVVKLLNDHFNVLTKVAFDHGGTVDKFIGDSVMVLFGAPIYQKDHEERAVKCAIEMQKKMSELNSKRKRKIFIGVSINSGEAVIGNIGSEQFVDYTAIGDVVNTASRMQSAADAEEIVISDPTFQAVKSIVKIQGTEEMVAKGKKNPIKIYKVKW